MREPLDVKIARVPEGKDPCDFCIAKGGDEFRKVLAIAKDAMTYHWKGLRRQFRGSDAIAARQAAMEQLMSFVARVTANAVISTPAKTARKWAIAERMASLFGVPVQEINQRLRQLGQKAAPPRMAAGQAVARPASVKIQDEPLTGMLLAEAWVLGALLAEPALYGKIREEMNLGLFQYFRPLAEQVVEYQENSPELASCSLTEFISSLDGEHQWTDKSPNRRNQWAGASGNLFVKRCGWIAHVRLGGKPEQNLNDGWKLLWELEMEAATEAATHSQVDVRQLAAARWNWARHYRWRRLAVEVLAAFLAVDINA